MFVGGPCAPILYLLFTIGDLPFHGLINAEASKIHFFLQRGVCGGSHVGWWEGVLLLKRCPVGAIEGTPPPGVGEGSASEPRSAR